MVDDPTSAALHGRRRVRSPSSRKHRTAGCRPQKGDRFREDVARAVRIHAGRACPPRYIPPAATGAKTRITVSCPRCGIGAHFLILIMSRRPPAVPSRPRRIAQRWTSGTDGPWFDLVITQVVSDRWAVSGAAPRGRRSDWLGRSGRQPLLFPPWIARTTPSSPIFGKPTQVITASGLRFKHPLQSVADVRPSPVRLRFAAERIPDYRGKTPVVASGTILWARGRSEAVFSRPSSTEGAPKIETRRHPFRGSSGPLSGAIAWSRLSRRMPQPTERMPFVAEIARRCGTAAQRDYGHRSRRRPAARLRFSQAKPAPPLRQDEVRTRPHQHAVPLGGGGGGTEGGEPPQRSRRARILGKAIEARATAPRRGGTARRRRASMQNALSRAPEFYAFLRTMEASRTFARKEHDHGAAGGFPAVRRALRQQIFQRAALPGAMASAGSCRESRWGSRGGDQT